ncbi:MAG: flagellar assembly peptidoglycan hydrolase FlgJ, partial [Gammaproteobacteria bacterium]|nr:flagellar assembly peptidoglycan hydrolase FlgJ [Gammaproteobacteria bacterium]
MAGIVENPNVYTDLAGLQSISRLGRENTPEGLRQVAQQFESMFINMMLKSMRDSNSSLFEDNYMRSNEMEFHQENLDNQLSLHMASVGGIGLADSLYRQMLTRFDDGASIVSSPVAGSLVEARQVPERSQVTAFVVPALSPAIPVSDATNIFLALQPVAQEEVVAAPVATAMAARVFAVPSASRVPISGRIKSPEDFVVRLLPMAEEAAARLGVDPRVLLAQSALETGWGQAIPARNDGINSHNLFGVKADARWTGEKVSVSTLEHRDGVVMRERANFRAYQSYQESFTDYVDFLESNPRYAQALQHAGDADSFVLHLQKAGYATDPAYAKKIRQVMNS